MRLDFLSSSWQADRPDLVPSGGNQHQRPNFAVAFVEVRQRKESCQSTVVLAEQCQPILRHHGGERIKVAGPSVIARALREKEHPNVSAMQSDSYLAYSGALPHPNLTRIWFTQGINSLLSSTTLSTIHS